MSQLEEAWRNARKSPSDSNNWELRQELDAARRSGRAGDALEIARQAAAEIPHFEPLRSAVAWIVYAALLKDLDESSELTDRQAGRAAIDEIAQLQGDDLYGKFSAYPQAVLKFAKLLQDRWPGRALTIYEMLDPLHLGTEHSGDFPSQAARYYLGITKCLEAEEEWKRLVQACDAVITKGLVDNDNLVWVLRRRGLALLALGDGAEAVRDLRDALRRKDEWYIAKELGDALAAVGDTAAAIEHYRLALSRPTKELSFRWLAVMRLGESLKSSDPEAAIDHLALARDLRAAEGWSEDPELDDLLRQLDVDPEHKPDRKKLAAWWASVRDDQRVTGVVETVFDHRGAGFVSVDDTHESLYFAMKPGSRAPAEGTRVSFEIIDSFDKKKKRPSQRATNVRTLT